MQKFRKRALVIEAVQFKGDEVIITFESGNEHRQFCVEEWREGSERKTRIALHTLEGDMIASPGDWIIKGVKGEFYPCKPDIFSATYETV